MKAVLVFALLLSTIISNGQDKIVKMTGDTLKVNVTAVTPTSVSFTYPDESVTNTLNKKAVQQIIYKSGRKEEISEKIVISGESDYSKVIVTRDPSEIAGLTKKGDVKGTAMKAFGNFNKLRDTATSEIQKDAARIGGFIVLIQTDNQAQDPLNNVKLTGTAYGY